MFGCPLVSPPADDLRARWRHLPPAGFDLLVREIPGHSSGHVVYIWGEGQPPIVFGGDVLFAGSVGRTDIMVDGDFGRLAAGIRSKLYLVARRNACASRPRPRHDDRRRKAQQSVRPGRLTNLCRPDATLRCMQPGTTSGCSKTAALPATDAIAHETGSR